MTTDDNVCGTLEEADELVGELVATYRVVKGPSGIALIGKRGELSAWRWLDARDAEGAVFGNARQKVAGPHKAAIISRLRNRAPEEAAVIAMHPESRTGRTERLDDKFNHWRYVSSDGKTVTELGGPHDLLNLSVGGPRGVPVPRAALTQLGVWPGSGASIKAHGALVDGHVAYMGVANDPLRIVVPCGNGATRDVIVVVEREQGIDVLGLRIERPVEAGSTPSFQQIGSAFSRDYCPLWLDPGNKTKLRVLKLPRR